MYNQCFPICNNLFTTYIPFTLIRYKYPMYCNIKWKHCATHISASFFMHKKICTGECIILFRKIYYYKSLCNDKILRNSTISGRRDMHLKIISMDIEEHFYNIKFLFSIHV